MMDLLSRLEEGSFSLMDGSACVARENDVSILCSLHPCGVPSDSQFVAQPSGLHRMGFYGLTGHRRVALVCLTVANLNVIWF